MQPLAGGAQVKAINSVLDQYKNWAFVLAFTSIGLDTNYYADIPADQYQEIDPDGAYQTTVPKWIFYVLFLGWGWIIWRIWCRIS